VASLAALVRGAQLMKSCRNVRSHDVSHTGRLPVNASDTVGARCRDAPLFSSAEWLANSWHIHTDSSALLQRSLIRLRNWVQFWLFNICGFIT